MSGRLWAATRRGGRSSTGGAGSGPCVGEAAGQLGSPSVGGEGRGAEGGRLPVTRSFRRGKTGEGWLGRVRWLYCSSTRLVRMTQQGCSLPPVLNLFRLADVGGEGHEEQGQEAGA